MGSVMVYRTKEEMLQVLGSGLRAARLAENLSQQDAADRSGVSLKAIRNIESGANASTLSLVSYCRTLRKTDWIVNLAPPEIDESLFARKDPLKPRQRAGKKGGARG